MVSDGFQLVGGGFGWFAILVVTVNIKPCKYKHQFKDQAS